MVTNYKQWNEYGRLHEANPTPKELAAIAEQRQRTELMRKADEIEQQRINDNCNRFLGYGKFAK